LVTNYGRLDLQSALISTKDKNAFHLGAPALLLAVFTFSIPAKTANYNFRHFSDDEGMTVSFSRNSPPLAALEDERLPIIKTEPVNQMIVPRHAKVIGAFTVAPYQRLQKYALAYEKRHLPPILQPLHIIAATKKNNSRKPLRVAKLTKFSKLTKVSELTKLLVPVNENVDRRTVRQIVEAPLTGREAIRNLPAGEEIMPVAIPADRIVEGALPTAPPTAEPIKIPLGSWRVAQIPASPKPTLPLPPVTSLQSTAPKKPAVHAPNAVPPPNNNNNLLAQDTRAKPGLNSPAERSMAALSPKTPADDASLSRITGQVELTGGLAATGQTTQLQVIWKRGSESKEAQIDYSTGNFAVDVPSIDSGKLIASVVDVSGRVLGEAYYDLDGAAENGQNILEGVKLIIEPKETSVKGRVYSAYTVGDFFIPAKDSEVFAPNGVREMTDPRGNFKLSGINSDSTLLEEAYAPEHWGTRVLAEGGRKSQIPLFPVKMLQSFFDLVGQPTNNSDLGVIWGEVKHRGKYQEGVQVKLAAGQEGIGPFYFNTLRIPDKNLTATSANGMFAFVKVQPGLHLVFSSYKGRSLPTTLAVASASMVSYSEIAFKSANVKGHVKDPITKAIIPAQISVVGSTQTVNSSQAGFEMRVPSSDPVLFVEANAGPEYLISREAVARSKADHLDIYAFKKDWLTSELNRGGFNQNMSKGIFVGFVKGPAFHVTIDAGMNSEGEYSEQNIGYFNSEGHLEEGLHEGHEDGGGFVLTNLKPGLHTLVITSAEGEMNMSKLFVAEAGVVNVVTTTLRP
jgi:hypothetical protein